MMVGLFSSVGPVGADIAAVVLISEIEKDAWKYLCFALILGVGGFHLMRYALRHCSIVPRPVFEGGPPGPIEAKPNSFRLDPDA
jgi:hypothetical protein